MTQRFEVQFCVPPGNEYLIAELYFESEHFGELNTENGRLDLVLFPRASGAPWTIPAEVAIDGLRDAAAKLASRSNFFDRR